MQRSASVTMRITIAFLLPFLGQIAGNNDAKRLYDNLMNGHIPYNKLIRPTGNNSVTLIVFLGLRFTQLIDVDEKNQIMTSNVWLDQMWTDGRLAWKPAEYGGVSVLYIPSTDLWIPDIVLYNNADGDYQVTKMTKITVFHNGTLLWRPPMIYKSACEIDIEYYPFDEQLCYLKFSCWSYNGLEIDLMHLGQPTDGPKRIEQGVGLQEYSTHVEWDLIAAPAEKKNIRYPCCPEPYPNIYFYFRLRRKTLFYTVNLVIPCLAISFLTILVFYLPTGSGEKMTLSISILLSLTVFFLLLVDLIPPTSSAMPLIGKYLLFTMTLVTLSIIITVVVINVHFRSKGLCVMSPWVRRVFLEILPRLLRMQRPRQVREKRNEKMPRLNEDLQRALLPHGGKKDKPSAQDRMRIKYPAPIQRALEGVDFIADHLREDDDAINESEDWQYVALVLDRLFLYIFGTASMVGTLSIILQAPTLWDRQMALSAGAQ